MQVRRREKVAIFALVAARVIYATNWLNIGAIFKLMETTLGVGVIGLGDVTSSFYLGLGLVQIPAGVLAARVGPKRVVVSGVVLYSLATLGVAASSSLAQVVALRFVVGPAGQCVEKIHRFVEAGCSKFVLRPSCPPDQVLSQIEAYARHILPHFGP